MFEFWKSNWPSRVGEWFNAHAQGFKGLVIGMILGGVLAARIACEAVK